MAKQETLWRCSTCDKLYGSEKEALNCEEKHALLLEIQSIADNPAFEIIPQVNDDDIMQEDITDESYETDAKNPTSMNDINIIAITTYSTVVRRDTYRFRNSRYDPKTPLFDLKED